MEKVKLAIIGAGNIGWLHMRNLKDIDRVQLVAVCDSHANAAQEAAQEWNCECYTDYKKLLKSKIADAILIATPHYSHTTIGIEAFKTGHNVLVEKPISVHKADCEKLIAAHKKNKKLVFAAMFNQRTDPCYKKIKKIITEGRLGKLMRVNWIITTWFRTDAYFKSGSWRATWGGEGGGALLNQCPHQLDLLVWLCGMPSRVQATCHIGKWHNIEVEDEVTAYMEYPGGATGVFITSTGEAPGTNRLEIAGEMGKIVVENSKLTFTQNEESCVKFCKKSKEGFAVPDVWNTEIPVKGSGGQHTEIVQNFVDAILDGTELIAPADEGIKSVELGNAMLYSSIKDKTVDLPLDSAKFHTELKKLIKSSSFDPNKKVKRKSAKKAKVTTK